jgi:D-threonate/D-erythronate kinase
VPVQAAPTNELLAVTSDSRHLAPQQAASQVTALIEGCAGWQGTAWYKKIDSTLRGNIGAELEAMLAALGRSHALVCPAFPAQGRGLHNGLLVAPALAGTIHLPTLLRKTSIHASAAIPLEIVRAGVAPLAEHLSLLSTTARLLIVDALSDTDLRTIVQAAAQAVPHALPCGSAGLIGVLSRELTGGADLIGYPRFYHRPERAIVVVGSASPQAHRQIAALCAAQAVAVATPNQALYDPDGPVLLLHLPQSSVLPPPAEGRAMAAQLATYASQWIKQYQPDLLVLVGGDTAISVLHRLGVTRLNVLRELLPGIALCKAVNGQGQEILVVLKAGNHGDEHVLATILQAVSGKESDVKPNSPAVSHNHG